MSATSSENLAQDATLFLYDGVNPASDQSDWNRNHRLTAMKCTLELFASEVADELASIRSLLGVPLEIDRWSASSSETWSPQRAGNADPGHRADEDGRPADACPAGGPGVKAHDRIAALKERLAEKLRDETDR